MSALQDACRQLTRQAVLVDNLRAELLDEPIERPNSHGIVEEPNAGRGTPQDPLISAECTVVDARREQRGEPGGLVQRVGRRERSH